jgi:hypothetical protein
MQKLTILPLVAIFLITACTSTIQPVKASVEEVATSASITIQPENFIQGQPFTVVVQINPHPPTNSDIFYNIYVMVTSAKQGISGYGPWSGGPSISDANGVATFTFPETVSATIAETGGGNIRVDFPGQYFVNNTIHYESGVWQKKFFFTATQTPTPAPTPTPSPTPIQTATPTPPQERNPPHLELIDYLLPLSIIIVIIIVSVPLFRRHRKTDSLSK